MAHQDIVHRIRHDATRDGVYLDALPFLQEALDSISALSDPTPPLPDFAGAWRIDTHAHAVPAWFAALEPQAAGRPTPKWDPVSHLHFMADHSIVHSILSISTPQANAYLNDQDRGKTHALARILNEYCAAVVRTYPTRFSFMAVTCLPDIEGSKVEVKYAIDELGAVGVSILTNHGGVYPGDERFRGFWEFLNQSNNQRENWEVVFIHPTDPVIQVGSQLVPSNPSPFRSGLGEFYFETARAISSLTASTTLYDFPNIHWQITHGGGAFPCIADRFLLGFPKEAEQARKIYTERLWYDSAGPVYPRQIRTLFLYDVPVSHLLFGTDYPYGIGFWDVDANIAGLTEADFLSDQTKQNIFNLNARTVWKRIPERR